MERWEYRVIFIDLRRRHEPLPELVSGILNEHGREGWEAATTVLAPYTQELIYTFKRRIGSRSAD